MNESQPIHSETGANRSGARRRWWLLLPVVVSLAVAFPWLHLGLHSQAKIWRAESQVAILDPAPITSGSALDGAPPQADDSLATQMLLIQSPEMARRTQILMMNNEMMTRQPQARAALTADDIRKAIKVTNLPDTNMLVIAAEANDPTLARDLANATALAFRNWKQEMANREVQSRMMKLRSEVRTAGRAMDWAEQQASAAQAGNHRPGVSAKQLKMNAEIATALYRRVQTDLTETQLQLNQVSGNVEIVESAVPTEIP